MAMPCGGMPVDGAMRMEAYRGFFLIPWIKVVVVIPTSAATISYQVWTTAHGRAPSRTMTSPNQGRVWVFIIWTRKPLVTGMENMCGRKIEPFVEGRRGKRACIGGLDENGKFTSWSGGSSIGGASFFLVLPGMGSFSRGPARPNALLVRI